MNKKIVQTIICTATLLVMISCSDFINEIPNGNTGTTGNFYKNKEDINYALTAAYANLQETSYYKAYMVLMTDVRSDDLSSFANTGGNAGREYSIKIFTAQSDNQIFREVWKRIYETIYRCNNVIKYVGVVNDESLRAQYEAEARFLRALCYFNIVRFWGDAPLILEPLTPSEMANCERNKVTDIYTSIENDLKFAADKNNLPIKYSGNNIGRASSLAAEALLGKVYLQQKKWNDAKLILSQLINTDNAGTHTLLPDIADVFSTAPKNSSEFAAYKSWNPQTMNKEILFEVIFNKDIPGEGRDALVYYANQADINEEFKSSSSSCIYSITDRRADLMQTMKGTNSDNNLLVKYADIISNLSQYGYNTPILRWSDVLLMYAEACNEVNFDNSDAGDAMKYLNMVRTRSYPTGAYKSSDLSSQEKFRDAIFLERRLEFPMEMQRWFDLLRSGKAIETIKKIGIDISDKDLLYPIPYSEVILRNDSNKFPQNPGY